MSNEFGDQPKIQPSRVEGRTERQMPHRSTVNTLVRVLKSTDSYEAARQRALGSGWTEDVESNPGVIKAKTAKEAAEKALDQTPEYRALHAADAAREAALESGNTEEAEKQRVIGFNALVTQIAAKMEATTIFNFQKVKERMRGTGFIVGGRNETSVIRELTQINGIPIPDLERNMRGVFNGGTEEDIEDFRESVGEMPKPPLSFTKLQPYFEIFLGPEESLIDLLAEDNDTISGMGLTHQQLADFLNNFINLKHNSVVPEGIEKQGVALGTFTIGGIAYYVEGSGGIGSETSPFQDGQAGSFDFFITRVDDGSQIHFGSMQPEMIRRYGFYEGKKTIYRIDPRKLAEFAGLIPH